MQDSHVVNRPGPARPGVTPRMLRSTRVAHVTRVPRMLRNTVVDMALGMAFDIATGVGCVRDIGVGREAYPYPAAYPNSSVELKFISKFGYRRWNIIFPSRGPGKEPRKGHDQSLRFNPCSRSSALQNLFLP